MSVLRRKDGLQKIWQSLWLGWFFCPFPVLQAWIRLRAFTYIYQFRLQEHIIQTFLRETWPYSEFFWSVMIQCSNLNDEIWVLSSTSSVTICVNHTLIIENFPITLRNVNVTPVHKNDDPTDKTNFRPVNVLPLSKVFERIIHNQLGKYMDTFLNKLLCGFRKVHSTQHALFKFLQRWQKELDNSGLLGVILIDLSKAYGCLPRDFIIAKFEAHSLVN